MRRATGRSSTPSSMSGMANKRTQVPQMRSLRPCPRPVGKSGCVAGARSFLPELGPCPTPRKGGRPDEQALRSGDIPSCLFKSVLGTPPHGYISLLGTGDNSADDRPMLRPGRFEGTDKHCGALPGSNRTEQQRRSGSGYSLRSRRLFPEGWSEPSRPSRTNPDRASRWPAAGPEHKRRNCRLGDRPRRAGTRSRFPARAQHGQPRRMGFARR